MGKKKKKDKKIIMQKREGRIWGHGHVGEKERLLHGAARTCQRGG